MYIKPEEEKKAQYLYLQTDLSQQEIADLIGVNRKTLYNWITLGKWKRAKYIAKYAPPILIEQYYTQLGALNNEIALRADRPYPTKEEAEIIRKLTISIRHAQGDKRPVVDNIELFIEFANELRRKDTLLAQQFIPHMDEYIELRLNEGHGLDSPWKTYLKEREDELEYEEWQRTQNYTKENREYRRSKAAAEGNPHIPFVPHAGDEPTETPAPYEQTDGEFDGQTEPTPNEPEPLVVNTIEQDTNIGISPTEKEKQENPIQPHDTAYYTAMLEERYKISQDPYVYRTPAGITIIKAPSPLWGRSHSIFAAI